MLNYFGVIVKNNQVSKKNLEFENTQEYIICINKRRV